MTIAEQIYAALSGNAALVALVGARITAEQYEQKAPYPQVMFRVVSRSGLSEQTGTASVYQARVSIGVASFDLIQLSSVRALVHATMVAFRSESYPYNPTTFIGEYAMVDPYNTPKLHTCTLDYYVWIVAGE